MYWSHEKPLVVAFSQTNKTQGAGAKSAAPHVGRLFNVFKDCEELIANFDEDQKSCIRATHDYFAKQSKGRKFKQAFSRLLSPIL